METVVRMGEGAVATTSGAVLSCIGLGSCIGLVLVDRRGGVAALAHVMLPGAARDGAPATKFAESAVDALVADAVGAGALRVRLEAVLVGGAAMFQLHQGSGQDIGARNEAGVRAGLAAARIPVRAAATGGGRGRTVRVTLDALPTVVSREAGGEQQQLLGPEVVAA